MTRVKKNEPEICKKFQNDVVEIWNGWGVKWMGRAEEKLCGMHEAMHDLAMYALSAHIERLRCLDIIGYHRISSVIIGLQRMIT